MWLLLSGAFLISSVANAAEDFLVDRLKSQGFTCAPAEGGDLCKTARVQSSEFNYSQPIAVFVPKNVRHPTRMVLHLHGHRCICEPCDTSVEKMISASHLTTQMKEAAGSNAVLILPTSTGKCVNFDEELAPRFSQFAQWTKKTIQPAEERWTLSGHSGAGRALGTIVGNAAKNNPELLKKMDGVTLLDATYSTSEPVITAWKNAVKANPRLQIYSIIQNGGGTETGNRLLKNALPPENFSSEKTKTAHCGIPGSSFAEGLRRVLPAKAACCLTQPQSGSR